jgi:hypothetical protein
VLWESYFRDFRDFLLETYELNLEGKPIKNCEEEIIWNQETRSNNKMKRNA